MTKEETRLQVLSFSRLSGTPAAGQVLAKLRAGTIVWDVAVVVNVKDGAGRTMDIDAIDADDVVTVLLNDVDTSPNSDVPVFSAASKVAAAPPVPAYFGSDVDLRVNPSANTGAAFTYTVLVTFSSVLTG